MIDSSIPLLWEDRLETIDYLEGWGEGAQSDALADCGRARRLQIVMAEARSTGVSWLVIAQIFVDWVGVAMPLLPRSGPGARKGLSYLRHELRAAALLIGGRDCEDRSLISADISANHGAKSSAARSMAGELAWLVNSVIDPLGYCIMRGEKVDEYAGAGDTCAWNYSSQALAVIFELGGSASIDKCAELAYARLFPKASSAEARS